MMRYPVFGVNTEVEYEYAEVGCVEPLKSQANPKAIRDSLLYYPVVNEEQTAKDLPLIVFLHGWEPRFSPWRYKYLVEHLAKSGFMVLIAKYQKFFPGSCYMENASIAINNTISYIEDAKTLPGLAKDSDGRLLYGLLGYSLGAITSLCIAADYRTGRAYPSAGFRKPAAKMEPTPKPLFVYAFEYSNGSESHFLETGAPAESLGGYWSSIDNDTYIVFTSGDTYPIIDYMHLFPYWNALAHIPAENKQFIGFNSDLRPGKKDITRVDAMHIWPSSWPTVRKSPNHETMNALHYALLSSITAVARTAFYGEDYEIWYDNSFIGEWPDGTPINPPFIWHGDTLRNNEWPKRHGAG